MGHPTSKSKEHLKGKSAASPELQSRSDGSGLAKKGLTYSYMGM
jgi:hypothetical protein